MTRRRHLNLVLPGEATTETWYRPTAAAVAHLNVLTWFALELHAALESVSEYASLDEDEHAFALFAHSSLTAGFLLAEAMEPKR